ncbi:trypsin-like peptidase domain-containing protein [Gleimia sp. 6138-11-ORH1]|uniref:S1C family serine protease n=1 Tax=Gleimia sp. 6138-11-ORH1 TaxID=2973937 RepID=UPI0021684A6E|nr:trypsin-like peptidase domain-containing protein [Gleimia sp. 6138-11-ORH1]MCS4483891.1 trypsin-like peptidase domain-containing protein [Gleimia sp. 6138-11-ORH1]
MSNWNSQQPGEPVPAQPAEEFQPAAPIPPSYPQPSQATAYRPVPAPTALVVRRGPGWGALFLSMLLTAILTVVILFLSGITTTRFSSHARSQTNLLEPQTDGPIAKVVENVGEAPDWEAVANAVRPATVSLTVSTAGGGSTGSGVIWDNQGHIVTNYHVIDGAEGEHSINVVLSDGRLYHAEVIGSDKSTDLAVIKLKSPPADLVSGNLGSSHDLQIGQPVMAVGSPLGLSDTVTTGIISALNRPVAVAGVNPGAPGFGDQPQDQKTVAEPIITNAIQVDASINPGNSGGPLFDSTGRVIGINSSIASNRSRGEEAGSIGLGFAIPIDLVRNVVTQIIETGTVAHAQLGVSITNGVGTTASESRFGAEIKQIVPGSAAEIAGLKVGDVIIYVDGNQVTSGRSLTGYVRRYRPGDEVTLKLVRSGEETEVKVKLGQK